MNIQKITHKTDLTRWLQRSIIIQVVITMLLLLFADGLHAETQPKPSNRVVIIIDSSGSYKSRQGEAVDRAVALLDAISQRKLHRWESDTDRISIIALDAIPEIIWEGSLHELKTMETNSWIQHFTARTDYAGCTDVSSAFRIAVRYLSGDPRYVHKYLFVFSDLIDEPPTDSIYRPRKWSRLPSGDFPWEQLQGISVSVFWVPPEQKLAWRRAVEQHGLVSSFALYTTSESAKISIQPPAKAVSEITVAERRAERERYFGYAKKIAKGSGFFIIVVILLICALFLSLHLRQRRRPQRVTSQRVIPPLHHTDIRRSGENPTRNQHHR